MQKDYLIEIGDAAIATKTDAGKVKLNQLMNTTAAGAAGGSFWGLLVGVLFLNPLLGVAAGAAQRRDRRGADRRRRQRPVHEGSRRPTICSPARRCCSCWSRR